MALPTTPIPTTNLDQSSDVPDLARLDLKLACETLNTIMDHFATPMGLATLDSAGKLSAEQYDGQAVLTSLFSVDGELSGLDADLLDGLDGDAYLLVDGTRPIETGESTGFTITRATTTNSARARTLTLQAANSPGATAAGYGVELRAQAGNAAGVMKDIGYLAWDYTTTSDANEDTDLVLGVKSNGALLEALRIRDTRQLQLPEISVSGNAPSNTRWLYATAAGLATKGSSGGEVLLTGGTSIDHGTLTGLLDDDHSQYLRQDGTRVLTGTFQLGANSVLTTDLGGDPAAPSAGQVLLYTKAGQLWYRSSSATVGPITAGGGVTTHAALSDLAALNDDHPHYLLRQPTADVVLNDSGGAFSYRIEQPGRPNLFVIDDAVAINKTNPNSSDGLFQIWGLASGEAGLYVSTVQAKGLSINVEQSEAASIILTAVNSNYAALRAWRTCSADPGATSPVIYASDQSTTFGGTLFVGWSKPTTTSLIDLRIGNPANDVFRCGPVGTGFIFNNAGLDYDFRIAGQSGQANLLRTDASLNTVNVCGTLNEAAFNVSSGSDRHSMYSLTTNVGRYAAKFESQAASPAVGVFASAATGVGSGIYIETVKHRALQITKNLNGYSPGSSDTWCVAIGIDDPTDPSIGLAVASSGTGDLLHLQGPFDEIIGDQYRLRVPAGGGAIWQQLDADMASAGPNPYWCQYFKTDGLYLRSPSGQIIGPIGTGGGIVTSLGGAERRPDHVEQLVPTTSGAAFVVTSVTAPDGCYIERVLVRTVAAVSGGYHVGVLGADKRWGDTVSGNIGSTNLAFAKTPAPMATGDTTVAVRLTAAAGTFADNNGRIRVTIFFVRFTAATS